MYDAVVDQLNSEAGEITDRRRRLLIAEPVGLDEWIVTENRMEGGGRLSHRVRTVKLTPEQVEQIHHETPDEFIRRNWAGDAELAKALLKRFIADRDTPKTEGGT